MPAWSKANRALPSWFVALCAAVVALMLVAFVVTGEQDADVVAEPSDTTTSSAAPGNPDAGTGTPGPRSDRRPHGGRHGGGDKPEQPGERRTAYVEVYNNSAVTGLASDAGALLQDSGWRVVATDNWYGSIPANTVYAPDQLRDQATLLARDLGIDRLRPAVSPMSLDRITVILTTSA